MPRKSGQNVLKVVKYTLRIYLRYLCYAPKTYILGPVCQS